MFEPLAAISTLAPVLAALLGYVFQSRKAERETQRSRKEIAEAESRVEREPERAKPAWDLARITLEAYFNRNLTQITAIFWLSVVVMLVGFSVLAWGLAQAVAVGSPSLPATLATASGVVTEFIGATFLFIYRSTIQQAINYSYTLERINSVGMAMQILDTMPESVPAGDLRSKTKATLVELLVREAYQGTTAHTTGPKSSRTSKAKANSKNEIDEP